MLTAHLQSARELRLRSYRVHELWNGAIPVRLLRIDLGAPGAEDVEARRQQQQAEAAASPGAQMFANRLEKNLKRLSRQAQRAQVSCYRLYDADMPEYSFAIDRYAVAAQRRRCICTCRNMRRRPASTSRRRGGDVARRCRSCRP